MKNLRSITGAAVLSLLALSGCANDLRGGAETQPATGAAIDNAWNEGGKIRIEAPRQANGVKIAFLGFGKDNPWSEWMFKAVEQEAAEFGATATFVGPTTFDAQQQYQIVSDIAVSKQYEVILIVPDDSGSIGPAIEQAAAAGVPAVAVSQPIGPDVLSDKLQVTGVRSQVVEDLRLNATAMAEGVINACQGKDPCKVDVLWGARSLLFDKVKPDIFYARLKGHDNIKLVCETDAGYTQELGRTQAADCLQANPDLNVIASQADESTRGAEGAVRAASRSFGTGPDDVRMVSSYASVYGIQQVRNGLWDMTTYNRPQSMGRAGVRLALLGLQGADVPAHVRMEDLDGDPFVLTADVLSQHPRIIGQWEG